MDGVAVILDISRMTDGKILIIVSCISMTQSVRPSTHCWAHFNLSPASRHLIRSFWNTIGQSKSPLTYQIRLLDINIMRIKCWQHGMQVALRSRAGKKNFPERKSESSFMHTERKHPSLSWFKLIQANTNWTCSLHKHRFCSDPHLFRPPYGSQVE